MGEKVQRRTLWKDGGEEALCAGKPSLQQVCTRHLADVIAKPTPSLGGGSYDLISQAQPHGSALLRLPSQEWSPPIDPFLLDSIPLSLLPCTTGVRSRVLPMSPLPKGHRPGDCPFALLQFHELQLGKWVLALGKGFRPEPGFTSLTLVIWGWIILQRGRLSHAL